MVLAQEMTNGMKTRITLKVTLLIASAVTAGYWAGYLHGSSAMRAHEIFIGLALLLPFLLVVVKAVCAIVLRPGSLPPSSDGGRGGPPDAPVPRPPGGRPPALSAAAKLSHEPAA
jgi:hypothetical protein